MGTRSALNAWPGESGDILSSSGQLCKRDTLFYQKSAEE